jgi:hypothetical protein
MGISADTRNKVATKIFGQPTANGITQLEKELIAIAAAIPTSLKGGNYGHAGMIVDQAKYLLMTGTPFDNPQNPGIYPANIAGNASNGIRARKEALHKKFIRQYEIYCRVDQALKDIILKAVNNDYLLEIEDKILGYLNQTPRQMIAHLRNRGGQLNFTGTKKLLSQWDSKWDAKEVPQVYFNQVQKAIRQLQPAGIQSNLNERRDMALFYLKASGEYNAAVREWEAKPAADKTWANIKIFISTKYAKENKQNKITAKQFKANWMEEQAEATEELIANLTEAHTKQMEILIKSTTESMKEMMNLMKLTVKSPANTKNDEKKTNRQERLKKYRDAPMCKYCNRKHPNKSESECWVLESDASSRPTNWKAPQST